MEYNTLRSHLELPEYGRNVYKLVEYIKTIPEKEKRTAYAKIVITIMSQVNPNAKDMVNYKHKLWDHLFMIADFDLDVDCPYPVVKQEMTVFHPDRLHYKSNHIKYRHYGKNLERIFEKLIEYEEGEEKEVLIGLVAQHLKKSYLTWNRDSVNDSLIYDQFNEMAKGKLQLNENIQLRNTRDILKTRKKVSTTTSGGKQKQMNNNNRKRK